MSGFTPEQVAEDGRSRVVRTGGQGGTAWALVLIATEALKGRGWLHDGISNELFGAYVLIVTVGVAALTNLRRLRGKA